MTAPKVCEYCGAYLDAGEPCDCGGAERAEHKHIDIKLDWRRPRESYYRPREQKDKVS